MTPELWQTIIGALVISAIVGLVRAHFTLRQDFSTFQLKVSENYANTGDIAKIERTVEKMQDELRSIIEILSEIRADLRAGNLQSRTPHG